MRRETPIDFELNIICLAACESRQALMLRKVRWTERARGNSKTGLVVVRFHPAALRGSRKGPQGLPQPAPGNVGGTLLCRPRGFAKHAAAAVLIIPDISYFLILILSCRSPLVWYSWGEVFRFDTLVLVRVPACEGRAFSFGREKPQIRGSGRAAPL